MQNSTASYTSFVSEESSFFADSRTYSAVYEFLQSGLPKIIYEHGNLQFENKEKFFGKISKLKN